MKHGGSSALTQRAVHSAVIGGALLLGASIASAAPVVSTATVKPSTSHAPRLRTHSPNAAAGNFVYFGGHIMSHVKVVAVFWGSGVASQVKGEIGPFYTALLGSAYMDWMGEYDTAGAAVQGGGASTNQHLSRGTFSTGVTITPQNPSNNLSDIDVGTELAAQINANVLPAPELDAEGGVNTLYAIYFSPGIVITDPGGGVSCNGPGSRLFCGYHSGFNATVSGKSSSVPFAVIPDMNQQGCSQGCGATPFESVTITSSHELAEAVSDPEVTVATLAWYDNQNGEIGDICASPSSEVPFAGYTVQKIWSQRLNACITDDPSLPVCGTQRPCRPCAATDNGGACNGATPVCETKPTSPKAGQCVACQSSADCTSPSATVCDTATDTCRGCNADADCSGASKKCDTQTHACVACLASTDCPSAAPVCDTASKTCRGCSAKTDCAQGTCATSSGDPNHGKCVECTTSADCASPQVCDPGTDKCVGCDKNSDCNDPNKPACDFNSHTCVATCGPGGCGDAGSGGNGNGSPDGGAPLGNGGGSSEAPNGGTSTSSGCAAAPRHPSSDAAWLAGALLAFVAAARRRLRRGEAARHARFLMTGVAASSFIVACAGTSGTGGGDPGNGNVNGNGGGVGADGGPILGSDGGPIVGPDAGGNPTPGKDGGGPAPTPDAGPPGAPLTCSGPGSYNNNGGGCGTERWSVKTGTDSSASSIALAPQTTTIASLASYPKPSNIPFDGRVSPQESTLWELKDVHLSELKNESDSDYHLVLDDGTNTMIAEIPFPGCATGGAWDCLISRARAAVDAKGGSVAGQTVSIMGVGFFDSIHGQTGVAPNGIELHPVLAICFGQGCDPRSQ